MGFIEVWSRPSFDGEKLTTWERSLRRLAYGLVLVLGFIGGKMLLIYVHKIPIRIALMATAGLMVVSVIASMLNNGPSATGDRKA